MLSTAGLALLVAGFFLVTAHPTSIVKRSPSESKDDECPGRKPCGWLVYNKSTRNTEFFMNNTCICPTDKPCLQTDDDLSVGAYVYRCIARKDSNQALILS